MAHLLHTPFLPSSSSTALRRSSASSGSRRPPPSDGVVRAKIREIFMPALSSTMTEGKIVSWVKSEGDKLSKGESVVVVESDKADMDVETFYDGYLAAIMVDEGDVAAVGAPIALLAENEDEIEQAKSKAQSPSSSSSSAPAPPPPPPPAPAAVEAQPDKAPSKAVAAAPAVASTHPASEGGKRVVASPYAKKLAKELKVELGRIVGTGPLGRIVAKDVEAFAASGAAAAAPLPVASKSGGGVELGSVVPFTTMQSAVSRNMVESLGVPTFRVGYTITTDALDALYKKIKSKGVTMTALLAKATALALVKHPVINSSCRDGNSFTYNSSINIAVAVAIEGGLITPVLQDADKVDVYTLSRKWKELVDKARAKQLQPNEYSTGTFTLSNLGMFGVDRFDAILPPGTGAIMAVGSSQPTVVATKIKSKGVTMTALLGKATALVLVKHPIINSSCRDGNSFTYNSSINIAVAVATKGGLITPVLQDADKDDVCTLSRKWKELVDKDRAKQLQTHEYSTVNDFTTENLEDGGWLSRLAYTFLFWHTLSVVSPGVSYASDSIKMNEIYAVGELFDLSIQLLYLLSLLGLLGVGTYFVIRQVLVRRELDLSAKELQEQVRSGDASATELFELGAVMLRRKFYPAATKFLLQAIEKWDGDKQDLAQVYNALGVSYVRDGKVDKGIAQFEMAAKLQPGYVTAWNNLGDAFENKKEYRAALKAFEEVLLFDPNNKIARPRRDALKDQVEMYKGVPIKYKEK